MKFQNIGGATGILEHDGIKILFDPWLDEGIYHGAWHHFPPTNVSLEELPEVDYIYISHIHEDHCSLKTLQSLNKTAEIIILDNDPNYVLKFLKGNEGLDFKKIHMLKEKTPTIIGGIEFTMLMPNPSHEMSYLIDSMLAIKWDGHVIFNGNDCRPHADTFKYLKDNYEKVGLALLQYAGGSGYPACYLNLSDDEKLSEAKRIADSSLDEFYKALESINPRYAMPFADQYVIVGKRAHLNQFMAHPASPASVKDHLFFEKFQDQVLLLNSGQIIDLKANVKVPSADHYRHSNEERDQYVTKHSVGVKYDYEYINFAKSVSVASLVKYARAKLWAQQERRKDFREFNIYLGCDSEKEMYELSLNSQNVRKVKLNEKVEPYLSLRGDRNLMIMMLMGHISWNIADAGLFIDYERVPNRFDTVIHALVNYLRI